MAERCTECGYAFEGPGDSIACLASIEQTLEAVLAEIKKQEVQEKPFDPRTEVSADAKYIGAHIRTIKNILLFWVIIFCIGLVAFFVVALFLTPMTR